MTLQPGARPHNTGTTHLRSLGRIWLVVPRDGQCRIERLSRGVDAVLGRFVQAVDFRRNGMCGCGIHGANPIVSQKLASGMTRRNKIVEFIRKTKKAFPEVTQWILWTRHPLTAGYQEWFNAIKTKMRLVLWDTSEA